MNKSNNSSTGESGTSRWMPRFGIGGLLLITVVFSVMGAAARQFVLVVRQGSTPRAPFVIFTLAAPMIVVAVMGIFHHIVRWTQKR